MEMKVKDFAKVLGEFVDASKKDYKVIFIYNGNEKFVVDSLADIGHSSNLVCLSIEKANKCKGVNVEELFNLFNDIKNTKSDWYDYGDFEVNLKNLYDDGSHWGFGVDVYLVDNVTVECSDDTVVFSIDLE